MRECVLCLSLSETDRERGTHGDSLKEAEAATSVRA